MVMVWVGGCGFDLMVELLVLMVEFSVWLVDGFLDICGCCGCSIGW